MDIDGADIEDTAMTGMVWPQHETNLALAQFSLVNMASSTMAQMIRQPLMEPVNTKQTLLSMPTNESPTPTEHPCLPTEQSSPSTNQTDVSAISVPIKTQTPTPTPMPTIMPDTQVNGTKLIEEMTDTNMPSPSPSLPPPDANAVPTDVHEIMIRAKELRLPGSQQPARMLRESRASGERPLDVALAEARIITENVYVQRKPRVLQAEEISVCTCKRSDRDDQMGCLEDCINRASLIECHPDFCPCGARCDNQRIQRARMPVAEVIDAGKKGLGIVVRQDVQAGEFVAEYMGEIVTEQEYHLRRLRYHNEKHRYMMVLSGGEVIDATRMGGLARFINHSCDPNCGVEKWEVHGEERCGIFALRKISAGEELCFDYKFQSFSRLEITLCLCGSANCRGYIGMNNRAAKQPRKANGASHTALNGGKSRPLDPITKKGMTTRKTLEQALELAYRAMAGRGAFTKREISMMLDSRLVLRRNLQRHIEANMQFLCLDPYFHFEDDFIDMQPVFAVRSLPDYPPKLQNPSKSTRHEHLEAVLERIRTRLPQ